MKRQSLKVKIQRYGTILILFTLIVTAGCARTVTDLFDAGKTITFEINFKEDINATDNRYYIVLRSAASPQIPFMPIEFIEPVDTPTQPDVDYFGTYYSTWDDYFILEGNNIYLTSGPFVTTEAMTREIIATWKGNEPRKIYISFDLSRLNLISNIVYFDFISVDFSDKYVKDNLSTVNSAVSSQYVDTKYSGTYLDGKDEETSGISGSLDILDWSVTIQ